MSHTAEDETAPAKPAGSFAYCSWHRRYSDDARLVQIEDQGSGFGTPGLFACGGCRKIHGLTPVAEQP